MAARSALKAFWRDESGATAIELGLIVALIAVVLISTLTAIGGNMKTAFNKVSTATGS